MTVIVVYCHGVSSYDIIIGQIRTDMKMMTIIKRIFFKTTIFVAGAFITTRKPVF